MQTATPLNLGDCASFSISRSSNTVDPIRPKGSFRVLHFRDGVQIGCYELNNGITDVGMNHLLQTEFGAGTAVTTWYLALLDNASFTALANGDTMASHSGWIESTAYSDATRRTWGAGTASARSITNSSTSDFNINATATIKGLFVTSDNTKGGTTGTLWSTAAFGSNVSVNNGDTLKLQYTVSG